MNVRKKFEEYRFMTKNRPLVEGELNRINNLVRIKTSGIKAEGGHSSKDTMDYYNDLIARKQRLETTLLEYDLSIELVNDALGLLKKDMPIEYEAIKMYHIECKKKLVNDALGLLKKDMPIEYEAIKMYHIECKKIFQIMDRLNFGKSQCWNYINRGERELSRFFEIVK